MILLKNVMYRRLGTLLLLMACYFPLIARATPTLRIAFSDNKAPYSSNCHCGVEFDLISHLVKKMGYRLEPFFVPNKRMTLMLQKGNVDAIVDVPQNTLRAGGFASLPYIQYHNVAISLYLRNIKVDSVSDLVSYRVVAFQNASGNLGKAFQAIVPKLANYDEVSPQLIQNHRLYSEHTDLVISDVFIFLASNPSVPPPLNTKQSIRIHPVFPPTEYSLEFKDAKLRDKFDYQLKHTPLSALYKSLQEKYLLPLNPQFNASPMPQWMQEK